MPFTSESGTCTCLTELFFSLYVFCSCHTIFFSIFRKYLFWTLSIAQQCNFKTTDIFLGGFSNKLACLPVLPLVTWMMLDVTFCNVFGWRLKDTTTVYKKTPNAPGKALSWLMMTYICASHIWYPVMFYPTSCNPVLRTR